LTAFLAAFFVTFLAAFFTAFLTAFLTAFFAAFFGMVPSPEKKLMFGTKQTASFLKRNGVSTHIERAILSPKTVYTIETRRGILSKIHLAKKTFLLIGEKHIF
jgi:hypothetical protein